MFGVKMARCGRGMGDGDLTVRLYRLKDVPCLRGLFTPEILPGLVCGGRRAFRSLFSLWRWIGRTFTLLYLIQVGDRGRRRIVGFVGFHNIRMGRSAGLSFAIFAPKDRGRGYAQRALALVLRGLAANGIAERITAEVLRANVPSLRLMMKLDFRVRGQDGDRLLLERRLAGPGAGRLRPQRSP